MVASCWLHVSAPLVQVWQCRPRARQQSGVVQNCNCASSLVVPVVSWPRRTRGGAMVSSTSTCKLADQSCAFMRHTGWTTKQLQQSLFPSSPVCRRQSLDNRADWPVLCYINGAPETLLASTWWALPTPSSGRPRGGMGRAMAATHVPMHASVRTNSLLRTVRWHTVLTHAELVALALPARHPNACQRLIST